MKNFCIANSGKGIVVLVSDLLDKGGYEPALRYLLAQDMDIYVVHVLSPEERRPDLAGDLRLIDCEDGDQAEVTVSDALLKRYQKTLAAFIDAARQFCLEAGHPLLPGPERVARRADHHRLPAGARAGPLMLPQLINMLSWWQWLVLGAVPPAIVLLYFLKLKRKPIEVPSTYLWHRSIEDLHVNTIWQRLRRNLLLFCSFCCCCWRRWPCCGRDGRGSGSRGTASSS